MRRAIGPPCTVAVLPLSADVDLQHIWRGLIDACSDAGAAQSNGGSNEGMDVEVKVEGGSAPLAPITLSLPERRKSKFTLLPPPQDRSDPLALVEIGRCAEVVLCILPGDSHLVPVDAEGEAALSVLRALGMPTPIALVQMDGADGLKERSAAKKHAGDAFAFHLSGENKVLAAGSPADFKQIMRHLADSPRSVPQWRRHRPQVVVQEAEFVPDGTDASVGTLLLSGFVRYQGMSGAQLVHIPTAGDFQIDKIDAPPEPPVANEPAELRQRSSGRGVVGMEAEAPDGGFPVLAQVAPTDREPLVRENDVDPLDGEQTWPTEEELADAAAARTMRKRRLPRGTSDYQAAWILDDEGGEGESEGDVDDEDADMAPELAPMAEEEPDDDDAWQHADGATEVDMEYEDDEVDAAAAKAARRAAETDDVQFPDEVDAPADVSARQRFARYQGLKSFRTSPWDPKEDLPTDYARVFAFENFRRAHRRAKEASAQAEVGVGTYARVHAASVPADAALRVVERVRASQTGAAPPMSCWGLLQHEAKLSVVNFTVKKAASYSDPVANKEELLLVTGVRSFPARPILSTDEHGADKFKMERFLHEGRHSVATVYAPISYPPLPLLAFKQLPGGRVALAATGTLRDCNPDRIILKKIVLTGYPVRVHKVKAVVRFMFNAPEDVRWFRPVELWTKHGRRGRIREPVGTHGAMKCIFDGPIKQQDAVCMSLFKRVYPKWPESDQFA